MKVFNRAVLYIIRLVAGAIGGYLGYVLTQWALGIVHQNTPTFRDQIVFLGIYAETIIYVAAIAVFAILFFIFIIPLMRLIFKLGGFIDRKLTKFSAAEITAGIVGLIAALALAALISQIYLLFEQPFLTGALMVGTYLLFGYLGIVLGRKYISQISFFTTKLPAGAQITVLDTSAIIDGRILELSKINFLTGKFVVANFVLNELRRIADSADSLKRNRGRRGLDIISSLQKEKNIDIEIFDTDFPDIPDLDTKILKLASSLNASVLTTDFNLNKVANVLNVKVINLNELSNAVKPLALPGEKMTINIIKQGKDKAQGVGFLEDGTMVVIENGGDNVGKTLEVVVSTSLQTNAGRMIFTRIEN